MAVENPQFINEFNSAWPDGLDSKSQGDDHIRNIKAALLRTFPNVTGQVTASHTAINKLSRPGSTIDPGLIMAWGYGLDTLPAGWKVCNGVGTISTGKPVPYLMDRVIVGAGLSFTNGSIGGSMVHGHTSTVTVQGHALTVAEMPSHNHNVALGSNDTVGSPWGQAAPGNTGGVNTPNSYMTSVSTGGGGIHTHGATAVVSTENHMMPYMALFWVIKD
ncbi:tail protein [Pseudomonas phage tf]|uniref:Tail fiber protein n=1 Tax=Pseudomonas phage tf TaxID=1114179 RepID=I2FLS7_9CAUD|nr:tail protein [Pseudomonas phage tf]CCE60811.1 tail fiber protein [Pseudomonas phage tf]